MVAMVDPEMFEQLRIAKTKQEPGDVIAFTKDPVSEKDFNSIT